MVIQALPSLIFLDDNKITHKERLASSLDTEVANSNDHKRGYKLTRSKQMENFECTSLVKCSDSLQENTRFYKRKPGSMYGKLKYKYLGKNSEGNRFINNNDL